MFSNNPSSDFFGTKGVVVRVGKWLAKPRSIHTSHFSLRVCRRRVSFPSLSGAVEVWQANPARP